MNKRTANIIIRKYNFSLIKIVVILFALSLMLVGISSCQKTPEKYLNEMVNKMLKVQKYTYAGTSNINIEETSLNNDVLVDLQFSGKTDHGVSNNGNFSLKLSGIIDTEISKLNPSIEFIAIDDTVYLRSSYDSLQSDLANEWYSFNRKEINELTDTITSSPAEIIFGLPADKKRTMSKLIKKNHPLIFKEDFGEEGVNGVNTLHYRIGIDKDIFFDLIEKYVAIIGRKPITGDEKYWIGLLIDSINENGIDIWIGKNDFYLYKYTISLDKTRIIEKNILVSLSLDIFLNNFNKKVDISAPEKFSDLNDGYNNFLGETVPDTSFDTFPSVPSLNNNLFDLQY